MSIINRQSMMPYGYNVTNPFEFHVSRQARNTYQFDAALFSTDGRAILADFAAARRFADQISAVRGTPVPASDINAMGLIDEIFHILIRQYEKQNPQVMSSRPGQNRSTNRQRSTRQVANSVH